MAKTVTMRLDEKVYRTFVAQAKGQRRSLSNFIEHAAWQYVLESEFTDAEETDRILTDRALVQRLRRAHAQAAQRKGRLVG